MEKKREDKHREIEEKRRLAQEKINSVVEMNKKIQADKRKAFNDKQLEISRFKKEKEVEVRARAEAAAKKVSERSPLTV